ncbi:hypothetical protein TrRE_jg5608 [Triparma retinervis]|uniref:J domain-containing protein n=1 Tax=Triparma retinervis TaxID=2557542 RepID=A0A9W7DKR5_9STRA|nr:hypothetical protein TrRE_jg5608 [Triparma retinervis]
MEVNKEQAEKCRDIAKTAMKAGDHAKAIKWFEKSHRLFPLPGVTGMIERCKNERASASTRRQSTGPSAAAREATETRKRQESGSGDVRGGGSNDQNDLVKKILRASKGRDAHYKVLGLDRGAGESEIKKAYRKTSLKVHPDKNPADKADEAFKAVGLAYATLSDPRKRQIYDATGNEDPDNTGAGGGNPFFSFPEDSGSGDSGSQYFSLTHKHPFTNPMETRHRGVVKDIPYFVSDKFMRTYYRDPYKVAQVERMVEKAYDTYLVNECRNQRKYKRQLEQRANNYRGNQETRDGLLNEAVKFELTRCEEHRELFQNKR